jgi:hypothetical protein
MRYGYVFFFVFFLFFFSCGLVVFIEMEMGCTHESLWEEEEWSYNVSRVLIPIYLVLS